MKLRVAHAVTIAGTALLASTAFAQAPEPQALPGAADKVLRVCADPNNLPLSHKNQQGFENKIAELIAKDLGWKLEYTWWPQRMGFIRNTLRGREPNQDRFKCDLIVGFPVGAELAATTKPMYRSTYAAVFKRGKGLDSVKTPDDLLKLDPAKLKVLKFGVFGQTPPADWLTKHGLMNQVVPFQKQTGDPEQYPGQIIEQDLQADRVDVAFAWGPIAGYFAQKAGEGKLAVVPFAPSKEITYDYKMGIGVRYGEREWRARLDQFIDKNRAAVEAVLRTYNVPLVDDNDRVVGYN